MLLLNKEEALARVAAHHVGGPNETFVLNLGPQHPATHGVLRVKLTMDGEYIRKAECVIGYIHRMHEKMGENRTCAQFLPGSEDFALDTRPPGWRWLELHADGRIETQVHWLEGALG